MKNTRKVSPTIENRKAKHTYEIIESLECGLSLRGNEVKSLRSGMANIGESWISFENGEMILRNAHITKWDTSNTFDVNERRDRILLAHKSEIKKLSQSVKEKGLTVVPLKIYFSDNGKVKVLVGLCRGLHVYDIRAKEAKATAQREIARHLSGSN